MSRVHLCGSLLPVALLGMLLTRQPLSGQVLHISELTVPEIENLNREEVVVLLPGGILEQHGPYLPSFSDGYMNQRLTSAVAEAIADAGGTALVFPLIPLGVGGANEIGGKYSFPGTYTVRAETMRAVFMDLATELGEQGFRRILVIHIHGAPTHNRILDEAGDYFSGTYGGRMVNLWGLMPVFGSLPEGAELDDEARAENGLDLHAGLIETSILLHLRPELVDDGYRDAQPQTVADWDRLIPLAEAQDWPGYTGSPRLARPEIGESAWESFETTAVGIALGILEDADFDQYPRWADVAATNPVSAEIMRSSLEHDERLKARQRQWLENR